MATRKPSVEWKKAKLIERIEDSRQELAGHLDGIGRSLQIAEGIRAAFRGNAWKWVAGSIFAGWVAMRARSRPQAKEKEKGKKNEKNEKSVERRKVHWVGMAAQTLFTFAQPYLLLLLQRAVASLVPIPGAGEPDDSLEFPGYAQPRRRPLGRESLR